MAEACRLEFVRERNTACIWIESQVGGVGPGVRCAKLLGDKAFALPLASSVPNDERRVDRNDGRLGAMGEDEVED